MQVYALRNLTELNLSKNNIKDEGAKNLAIGSYLRNLTKLVIDDNLLTDIAAAALAQSEYLVKLTYLFVIQLSL